MLSTTLGSILLDVYWLSILVDAPKSPMLQSAYAPLAQLAEQGPFKPKVVGSIPSRRTLSWSL